MKKPELLTLDGLMKLKTKDSAVWTLKRFDSLVKETMALPVFFYPERPPAGLDLVIAVGGGTLIDHAKAWRKSESPGTRLAAIPSIWGSGAENSPVAVIDDDIGKVVMTGDEFYPDFRARWDALADTLPDDLIRSACGDVWAHAIEGFLSPMAQDEVKNGLSALIGELLVTPVGNAPRWFELSAAASMWQSRSGVGLVHGIAHALEWLLRKEYPEKRFGHAKICANCLWPVLSFDVHVNSGITMQFNRYGISYEKVAEAAKKLFDDLDFGDILAVLEKNWQLMIRNPLTRTNCVLVRPGHLSYFTERRFQWTG